MAGTLQRGVGPPRPMHSAAQKTHAPLGTAPSALAGRCRASRAPSAAAPVSRSRRRVTGMLPLAALLLVLLPASDGALLHLTQDGCAAAAAGRPHANGALLWLVVGTPAPCRCAGTRQVVLGNLIDAIMLHGMRKPPQTAACIEMGCPARPAARAPKCRPTSPLPLHSLQRVQHGVLQHGVHRKAQGPGLLRRSHVSPRPCSLPAPPERPTGCGAAYQGR